MFLARQLPSQKGFRGAPSIFQGGGDPLGATFAAGRSVQGATFGRVIGRAPTDPTGRFGGGTGGADSPTLAAPFGLGGSRRPPGGTGRGPDLVSLAAHGGDALAEVEGGREGGGAWWEHFV